MATNPHQSSLLRITTAGSVDDGKSTLIGRLLYESQALLDDQLEALRKQRSSGGELDLSLVTDGLKSEREQGITIDVAYKYFSSRRRKFILADAPGHVQYTRNMVTAASRADAAIILVDARHGIVEQTRRHAYLVHLLRVPHVILAINKIDAIGYDQERIQAIDAAFRQLAWNQDAASLHSLPLSALRGDNVSTRSELTPWYQGPALLELLDSLPPVGRAEAKARLPVQLILRGEGGRRYASGILSEGTLKLGEAVRILPSRQLSAVAALWVNGEPSAAAAAGDAVALALSDECDLERGALLVHPERNDVAHQTLRAHLVWFDEEAWRAEERYILRLGTQTARAEVRRIEHRFDLTALVPVAASSLEMNDIALVELQASRPVFCQPFATDKSAGAFVLIDPRTFRTVAAGMVAEALASAGPGGGRVQIAATLAPKGADASSRTLQVPAAFLRLNGSKSQLQAFELLLESGWSLKLEAGPEAELVAEHLERRGFGTFAHGLGI